MGSEIHLKKLKVKMRRWKYWLKSNQTGTPIFISYLYLKILFHSLFLNFCKVVENLKGFFTFLLRTQQDLEPKQTQKFPAPQHCCSVKKTPNLSFTRWQGKLTRRDNLLSCSYPNLLGDSGPRTRHLHGCCLQDRVQHNPLHRHPASRPLLPKEYKIR